VAPKLVSIVDDDESLRAALVGLVRSLGYRAEGFAAAEDFLASELRRETACVVADVQLPGLSGIELTARMRAEQAEAPVIVITARADSVVLERASAAGALCVLRKPFAADALIDCLERALAD